MRTRSSACMSLYIVSEYTSAGFINHCQSTKDVSFCLSLCANIQYFLTQFSFWRFMAFLLFRRILRLRVPLRNRSLYAEVRLPAISYHMVDLERRAYQGLPKSMTFVWCLLRIWDCMTAEWKKNFFQAEYGEAWWNGKRISFVFLPCLRAESSTGAKSWFASTQFIHACVYRSAFRLLLQEKKERRKQRKFFALDSSRSARFWRIYVMYNIYIFIHSASSSSSFSVRPLFLCVCTRFSILGVVLCARDKPTKQ